MHREADWKEDMYSMFVNKYGECKGATIFFSLYRRGGRVPGLNKNDVRGGSVMSVSHTGRREVREAAPDTIKL